MLGKQRRLYMPTWDATLTVRAFGQEGVGVVGGGDEEEMGW